MAWQWIEMESALAVHQRQLAEHGGLPGIRDRDLLETALKRPKHLHDAGENDAYVLAATYVFGIVRNRPFTAGNKRTAYVLMRLFLRLHGEEVTPALRREVFESLSADELDETEFIAAFKGGIDRDGLD